jgi:hypothetical protein
VTRRARSQGEREVAQRSQERFEEIGEFPENAHREIRRSWSAIFSADQEDLRGLCDLL